MLRKLMKYEFKATGRVFLPLFGALLLISTLSRIFIELNLSMPQTLGITVSVILIIGLFVITFILTLQRFYKNLIEKEGYLMHTIPVKTNSLILSKLFTASIWQALSLIVVIAAIMILAFSGFSLADLFNGIKQLLKLIGAPTYQVVLVVIEVVMLSVVVTFSSILSLYMCMSFGLLFNKHRGLICFGFYVGLNFVTQALASIAALIVGLTDLGSWFMSLTVFGMIQVGIITGLVSSAVFGVAYFLVTKYMLSRRLNLE